MANTIRGLTIEIDADVKKFNSQFKTLKKDAKSTQSEFSALKKSLEIDFDSTKFAKAQAIAQQALNATRENAEVLQERLESLEKANAMDSSHYRQVKAELEKTNLEAQKLAREIDDLNKLKLNNLKGQVDSIASGLQTASKATAPFSAAAVGAIVGLGALGKTAASTGAEIDDLALRFGVSAEKIQEWQYVAVQTGVDVEVFNKALIKARAAVLDFSSGKINEQTKAIQGLNLELSSFQTQEDMFDGVINSLSNMEDKTLQAAYANEIFGDKIAYQLLPFLNAGGDAINAFKEEFRDMPYLTNTQVSSLATLDDILFRVKETFKNIALQIGATIAPVILNLTEIIENKLIPKLTNLMNWFSNLSTKQLEFAMKVLVVIAAISPLLGVLSKITSGISGIIGIIPKLVSALSSLNGHPIIATIGIIAMILMLLYSTNEQFRESINNLVGVLTGALTPVIEILLGAIKQLLNALMPLINLVGNVLSSVLNIIMEALAPVIEMLGMLFQLIGPLIEIALIPLQIALSMLQVPLQVLAKLLQWLMPIFTLFGKLVQGIFQGVVNVINFILGIIENAINWCIDKINAVIKLANKLGGWLGVDIGELGEVSLKIKTDQLDNLDAPTMEIEESDVSVTNPTGSPYDQVIDLTGSGTTNNYDYSTSTKTQNIEVVIQNYAEEVDVDDLVRQINVKLAEVM